jgi:hypothetical protein
MNTRSLLLSLIIVPASFSIGCVTENTLHEEVRAARKSQKEETEKQTTFNVVKDIQKSLQMCEEAAGLRKQIKDLNSQIEGEERSYKKKELKTKRDDLFIQYSDQKMSIRERNHVKSLVPCQLAFGHDTDLLPGPKPSSSVHEQVAPRTAMNDS